MILYIHPIRDTDAHNTQQPHQNTGENDDAQIIKIILGLLVQ